MDYDHIDDAFNESISPFPDADLSQQGLDADEAEHIFAQEESELQELISSMEEQQEELSTNRHETASQHYGSDDEDYDSLFMECALNMDVCASQHNDRLPITVLDDVEEMDMS